LHTLTLFFITSLVFGGNLKSLKYCGHIEITGVEGNIPIMMPMAMMVVGNYVSPTGIDPKPPKSCAWVFFDTSKGNFYLPSIVVWSDTFTGYHADIYSDPQFIFGHRREQPSDYESSGIMSRNKEMENYLNNAAGSKVIAHALRALRRGKRETTFENIIDVPIPMTSGLVPRLRVRYYLYEIEANPPVPQNVERLIELGRSKRIPHTSSWIPISVPAELLDGF